MDLVEAIRRARQVNTPLLAAEGLDQPALQQRIQDRYAELAPDAAIFGWDAIRGVRPLNAPANAWITEAFGADGPAKVAQSTGNPNAAVDFGMKLPERSIFMLTNADSFVGDPVMATGVLNLRDPYKVTKRTLILTGTAFVLPPALQASVVLFDEALPTDAQLEEIVKKVYAGTKGDKKHEPTPELIREAVTAGRGLSAFMAEQTYSMSMKPGNGLELPELWERKRTAFNQTEGVTLERANVTFDDIRGLQQIRARLDAHFAGDNPAAVIVRIEEIEKQFAGAQGDSSGTSQAALKYILDTMEDYNWTGFLALGPGGAGKSLVSKAIGATFNRPVVNLDVKGTEDKLVGESGVKIRGALKAIRGLAGDKPVLVVGTCNRIASLPPELRRRFRMGLWYFDTPGQSEREAIFELYLHKHGVSRKNGQLAPDLAKRYSNWTGAEIRNAVEMAATEHISIDAAAQFIVPVAEADPEALAALRKMAHRRFLNASAPGKFVDATLAAAEETERKGSTGTRSIDGED